MLIHKIKLAIIVPAYNEESNIEPFISEIVPILEGINVDWGILFIDDGSGDNTLQKIKEINQKDGRIKAVALSRNFGKESAITCGIEQTDSDVVIIMDADLQHPPSIIYEMIRLWRDGYNMVVPLNQERTGQKSLYKKLATLFYGIMAKANRFEMPIGGSDFRLIDRKCINAIKELKERNRFMKALYAYPGFRVATTTYQVRERKFGSSKWNLFKLWNFALDGILGFSSAPLKIWTYIGLIVAFCSFFYGGYLICNVLINGKELPGWTTLATLMLFFNGMLMISIGILGEYVARIFDEVKDRPLYFVKERIGCEQ